MFVTGGDVPTKTARPVVRVIPDASVIGLENALCVLLLDLRTICDNAPTPVVRAFSGAINRFADTIKVLAEERLDE